MNYLPAPLHIPENILSLGVSIVCWIITVLVLSVAISRTNKTLGEKQVPLMGVMAAFIFAAQMINFPILGGTSGHLLGGVLAAITLGPWAGMLVMTSVIAVQALLFQDGGLVVMGANILNMGLITAAIGYGLYRGVISSSRKVKLLMAGVAAWLSVIAGALFTSIEIWLSGNAQLQIIIPAMLGIHALIGVGETLITVAALTFIFQSRPDLLNEDSESAKGGRGWVVAGILISMIVLSLSPLASSDPDGLQKVAGDLGFINMTQSSPFELLPGYTIPFLGSTTLSTILAGAIGIVVIGVIITLIGQGLKARS